MIYDIVAEIKMICRYWEKLNLRQRGERLWKSIPWHRRVWKVIVQA